MRGLIVTLLLLIGTCASAQATPVTLKCTDSSGQPVADLLVDVEAGYMRWSISNYRITHQDNRYISAQEVPRADQVGGEIWVLDRVTGQYIRSGVSILSERFSGATPIGPKLQPFTYSGRCNAPLL